MVEKAPDAFRNITEVAGLLNVPAHVLRFWETRFSQIRPIKRSGGRRYYRPGDIALLRRIHALLYEHGYTIRGAQQVLKARGGNGGAMAEVPGDGDIDADSGGDGVGAEASAADSADGNADCHGHVHGDDNLARAVALLHAASARLEKL